MKYNSFPSQVFVSLCRGSRYSGWQTGGNLRAHLATDPKECNITNQKRRRPRNSLAWMDKQQSITHHKLYNKLEWWPCYWCFGGFMCPRYNSDFLIVFLLKYFEYIGQFYSNLNTQYSDLPRLLAWNLDFLDKFMFVIHWQEMGYSIWIPQTPVKDLK